VKQKYQKGAFNRIASAATDTPGTKEYGARDCRSNENSIDIANLGEGGNTIKKVAGGRDYGCGANEEGYLHTVLARRRENQWR